MVTMTMHVEDYFADALRAKAAEMGKSVNQAVKEMLLPFLGLAKHEKAEKPWMKFSGCCPDIDMDHWNKIIEDNRQIDWEMWK